LQYQRVEVVLTKDWLRSIWCSIHDIKTASRAFTPLSLDLGSYGFLFNFRLAKLDGIDQCLPSANFSQWLLPWEADCFTHPHIRGLQFGKMTGIGIHSRWELAATLPGTASPMTVRRWFAERILTAATFGIAHPPDGSSFEQRAGCPHKM
jgi:hypothetical protein